MHHAGIRARRIVVAALASLAVIAVIAPSAFAGTATFDGGSGAVSFDANAGEFNDVQIFSSGGRIKVRDNNNPVTPAAGCTADGGNQADCGATGLLTAIHANLGDKDDSFDSTDFNVANLVNAGEGDDGNIDTGDGNDTVNGEGGDDQTVNLNGGNDTFNGGAGNDRVNGGDGNDTLNGDGGNDLLNGQAGVDAVNGGAGDDNLTGGDGNDTVHGDAGDDTIRGDTGDDNLNGDDGNDFLDPGGREDGNDTLNGGAGSDFVSYFQRSDPVSVSADGVANDGQAGETDNVGTDVEGIEGGSGDDTLTAAPTGGKTLEGNDGNDVLNGGAGNENLYGQRGDDTLNGNDGADSLFGGGGNDVFNGGNGDDYSQNDEGQDVYNGGAGTDEVDFGNAGGPVVINPNGQPISGESGELDTVAADVENYTGSQYNDQIVGSAAVNLIQAGDGNDTILSRDAVPDIINCGTAYDTVIADGLDLVPPDGATFCEHVDRGSLAGVLGSQRFGSISTSISSKATTLTVPVLCGLNVQGGCQGVVTINTGGSGARAAKRVGKATFITPLGTRINVRVPLSKSSRKTLRTKKKLKVTISLQVQDARGASGTAKKTLTLKKKK
jgi:Ca2+-binding RTX toxin-like protein